MKEKDTGFGIKQPHKGWNVIKQTNPSTNHLS